VLGLAPEIAPIVLDRPYAAFESSPNPILRYVPRPGSRDIGAHGIRDRDYPLAKAQDTLRVLVLGDSIGFGFCTPAESLPREKTFAKALERLLNEAPLPDHRRAEVINLSVSGYDTRQEAEFLRVKGLDFAPDVVLVGYCLNDDADASLELDDLRANESWAPLQKLGAHSLAGLFRASHLARLLWLRLASPGGEDPLQDVDGAAAGRRGPGFDRIAEMGDDEGFETVIAIFPHLDSRSPYPYLAEHRRVRRDAGARGFGVIDLLGDFQRASEGDLGQLRGRCVAMHPDERGHEIAALRMNRFIRAQLLARGDNLP
jgi:hypothetical protein